MDLSGEWRAAAADEGLRRAYPDPSFDDGAWAPIAVPGHWRDTAAFAAHDGPLLYRRRFELTRLGDGRRGWLSFDGIFYQSDVWLDGTYVGDTEGYFLPHAFEVTDALRAGEAHTLAVEVACARAVDRTAKRNLTGVFQHWDCVDADANPGGIWRPVRLHETGTVAITRLRVLCTEASAERAVVEVRAVLHAGGACEANVTASVSAGGSVVANDVALHRLAAGRNDLRLLVRLDDPDLWWPKALGGQPLHEVEVAVDVAGERSDTATRPIGLREIRMKRWIMTVNGERLFLKGSNQGPSRYSLGDATPAELERDVLLALDTGLDLLRIHAHVTRPEFYAAADRHGLLLWQDLPLQWGYAHSVRRQAVRQARAAVDLLGHHPSVAVWCGHNEPLALDIEPGSFDASPARTALRFAALQELPTWNKTVLDGSIKRALEKRDPTRPVVAHSGVLPNLVTGGTDTHLYFGWYHGDERDLPRLLAAVPRLARFVTEFGAQAVPTTADFMGAEAWPDLDWPSLERAHALQRSVFDKFVPPADYATFDEWRDATQAYQATVVRRHVEALRVLKYRPAGGFCHFCFADAQPAVTWSVLDHRRVPKAGHAALAAACAPMIVVAGRPAASYRPGAMLETDVHVVSDLRAPIPACSVEAVVSWPGGQRRWVWEGDVPADACVRIGQVRQAAPSTGPIALDLTLRVDGAVRATNRYDAVIG